jgi:hypothetical protein
LRQPDGLISPTMVRSQAHIAQCHRLLTSCHGKVMWPGAS